MWLGVDQAGMHEGERGLLWLMHADTYWTDEAGTLHVCRKPPDGSEDDSREIFTLRHERFTVFRARTKDELMGIVGQGTRDRRIELPDVGQPVVYSGPVRSTPTEFRDGDQVVSSWGSIWEYSAGGDVWRLFERGITVATSARSYQMLQHVYGPLQKLPRKSG